MRSREIKSICICGGGNLGHAFAAVLGSQADLTVNLLTRHPEKWLRVIEGEDEDHTLIKGKISQVSSRPQEVIPGAELILVSLPCFAREELLKSIADYVSEGTIIGCMPGNGNFELLAHEILPVAEKEISIFGSLRIPYICRTGEYGKKVRFFKKPEIQVIASNLDAYEAIKIFFERYAAIEVQPLHNFLELVLSNSNPILHPARLFDLFGENQIYDRNIPFYEDWTNHASAVLIRMDEELFDLIRRIPRDLSGVRPLLEHYESSDAASLTQKIVSIKAFKGILSPMKRTEGKWMADFDSRYFTEDIPFGLLLIKSMMLVYEVQSPEIDTMIRWVQANIGLNLITPEGEIGTDASSFPIFQKSNILSPDDLERRY